MSIEAHYTVATPFGIVQALFRPDREGAGLSGPPDAVAHLRDVAGRQVDREGMSIVLDSVAPDDFFYCCQPEGAGIVILEPLPAMVERLRREREESAVAVLDDAGGLVPSPIEGLRTQFSAASSAMEKLGIAKKIMEYRLSSATVTGGFGLQASGKKTRERINSRVAEIVAQIQAGKDPKTLTPEELELFRQYSGRGGLTDNSQDQYYTPTYVAEGAWELLSANGFASGNVLEPSAGAGVFCATKPAGSVITGTEIDPIAATVNQVLHPADSILAQPFEKLAVAAPDNSFDAVIGNVPFGARGASAHDDPAHKSEKSLERYFISRVIDKTRPGGLITLVVPTCIVGSQQGPYKKFRAMISRKAEFLGAHKLPSKTFGKQGTDTVTDIIVLRKHPSDLLDKVDSLPSDTLESANVLWGEFIAGKYWQGEGRRFIQGQYVAPDKAKFRAVEQVIREDGLTDEALKRRLAVRFDSRIDWALLDSAEPAVRAYAPGDRKVINGKDMEFDGIRWAEVAYQEDGNDSALDPAVFGVETLSRLQSVLESPDAMLQLTHRQAFAAFKAYPNLLNPQQRMAVEFALSQPEEKFREQAYRGSLIGSLVSQAVARIQSGSDDDTLRQRVVALLENEYATFGHPRSARGFLLDGDHARHFGAFLGAVDENGAVSGVLRGGVESAQGYDPANLLSIVEWAFKSSGAQLELADVQKLYTGPRKLESLGDLADVDNIAITANGFIAPARAYLCGEIYRLAADIQGAMENEPDPRLKDKFRRQIDALMAKASRTAIEDINFGLRDKWIDQRYKLEFLEQSGYHFAYNTWGDVEKTSETGEVYTGRENTRDTSNPNGEWVISERDIKRDRFSRQLEHYMNGKSIGFRLGDGEGKDAEKAEVLQLRLKEYRDRIGDLEEQFRNYMQSHTDFADLERAYNLTFNHYVKPEYDQGDLELKGVSGQIKPHWYQNQGVRQLSEEGTGILGFDVGLGKTTTALAFSLYDRQMGRSNKHLIVVPNSVLGNWYMESKKFLGSHDGVLFVGFEPKRDPKTGNILKEAILDENGQPQVNKLTGEVEYQDILVKDSPDEVYTKMHKIPHTTAGLVVMTEEKYGTIPLREETRLKYAEKWAEKSMMSRADAAKMTKTEGRSYADDKKQNRLENQFADEGTKKKNELPYFEDMGFDRVIVDEGHRFRNSFSIQDGDTSKLAYLPNPALAQRASDMAMKMNYLRDKFDGKGSILLTATPVANSPIEIFNMLSLVIDQAEFERMGIYTPDDFVRYFGEIGMVDKLTVSGIIKPREGLKGFKNLRALREMFHRYANMLGPKDVDPDGNVMKLPEAVEVIDQLGMDDEQEALYVSLRAEAKDAGNPMKIARGEARPMFAVLRDMDRVTTDMDLYHRQITFHFRAEDEAKVKALIADMPESLSVTEADEDSREKFTLTEKKETRYNLSGDALVYVVKEAWEEAVNMRLAKFGIEFVDHPLRPKYAKLIANMQAELDGRGKQLVFTEEKSQHGKLARIIVNNLPVTAEQIDIINADTAAGEKLQKLSDAYNRGDIRIIIANKKAEVGVNLQKGTSAIHHMTLPWNPASLQQRNGRGVRQGNWQTQVRVYYYQAKGSFDEYRLDLLKNKGNWIANLMDKKSLNDSAENAEALGAIEQAALLSENREEFLAAMAEQKAKQAAADKARRDRAAVVNLNKLGNIAQFEQTFEADKAKAQADKDKAIQEAEAKLAKAQAEGADDAKLESLQRGVAAAKVRAAKVEAEWAKKKADWEAQKRQIGTQLRGQAKKGELPFDVAAVDDPLGVVMTKEGLLVKRGGAYKVQPKDRQGRPLGDTHYVRVVSLDRASRKAQLEKVAGGYFREGEYEVEPLFSGAVEVHLTADELERMKWLSKAHSYAEVADMGKDFFLEHAGEIYWRGVVLSRFDGGYGLYSTTVHGGLAQDVVFPDKADKALLEELTEAYKDSLQGKRTNLHGGFADIMPVFFGPDWEATVKAGFKMASPEELRAKAAGFVRQFVSDYPAATTFDIHLITNKFLGAFSDGYSQVNSLMGEWMEAGEFVNIDEAREAVTQAVMAEMERLREVSRQLQADSERLKNEALKSDPNYKEIPADLMDKFQAIGVSVFYNTEDIQLEGFRGRKGPAYAAFSRMFIKDRSGKNGVVFRLKEILKSRFGAQFCDGVARGDRKYGDSTWHVPASVTPQELFDLLG